MKVMTPLSNFLTLAQLIALMDTRLRNPFVIVKSPSLF
jgi:hypothetical protein